MNPTELDEALPPSPPPSDPEYDRGTTSGRQLKSLTNEKLLELTQGVFDEKDNDEFGGPAEGVGTSNTGVVQNTSSLGLPAPILPTAGRADSYRHAIVDKTGKRASTALCEQPAALEEEDVAVTSPVKSVEHEVECNGNSGSQRPSESLHVDEAPSASLSSVPTVTAAGSFPEPSRSIPEVANAQAVNETEEASPPMPVVHVSEDEADDDQGDVPELTVVDLSAVNKSKKGSSPKKKKRFWGYFKKPWKLWRRKKPSSKVLEIHEVIGRKISFRPNREEVIALGIVKEDDIHPDAAVLPPPDVDIERADSTASVLGRPASNESAGAAGTGDETQFLNITEPAGFGARGTRRGSVKGTPVAMALEKRISLRQSKKDLADRNIIREETPEEAEERKKSIRGILAKRISQRKTIEQLKEAKILKFDQYVDVYQTYRGSTYNRAGDRPWTQLTTKDKIRIKKELNDFKSEEMDVHPDSAKYTRFHK
eukprot:m.55325 g.55325  ORF g.55325 m.55325 type:complete len:482 (-) comp9246_c0_seq2:1625-3070(-)